MQNKKFIIILTVFLVLFAAVLMVVVLNLPTLLKLFEPKIAKKYDDNYATDGQAVYYYDRGYTKVDGADPESFISLGNETKDGKKIYTSQKFIAGKDKNNVYIKTSKITGLDRDKVYLLGANYVTDGINLYYEDLPVIGADMETFAFLVGFYARDKQNIYYKNLVLPNTDLASLQFVYDKEEKAAEELETLEEIEKILGSPLSEHSKLAADSGRKDANYLKDNNQVYYQGLVIPRADPQTFKTVHVKGDQWSFHYAKDKNNYYFRGSPLPDKAENWSGRIPPGGLKLLQADKNFGWAELFYYEQEVFAFDTKELKLVHFFSRQTKAPFVEITRGVYQDDQNVYFSRQREHWTKVAKRMRGRTLAGRYTILQPLDDVSPDDFKLVRELKGKSSRNQAQIFQAKGREYYHPVFVDHGSALVYNESDGSGFKPEDYSQKALGLHMQNQVVDEPLGLKQIKIKEKYAYYTSCQSFLARNSKYFLLGLFAVILVVSTCVKNHIKKRKKL